MHKTLMDIVKYLRNMPDTTPEIEYLTFTEDFEVVYKTLYRIKNDIERIIINNKRLDIEYSEEGEIVKIKEKFQSPSKMSTVAFPIVKQEGKGCTTTELIQKEK